ncbi:NrfD/PsrC family molybdoenzyme membrane anchor subunit [Sphaerisporangium sp. TRM90804]|uniref:NrfD/PsrC family molybdoenzyme membrane anchor subunit n=1 Tax=Sphaerisporangium sp. TRM90804 TaxID=3031113 RepID=UPI00244BB4B7|nr:NrfD/PsrC family molybdoenzyme membrane anchor subunit [Sphaerisporangium sp. TRM90804]MDH2426612.1 polysulfide reductase NrfD [Sphaerisporangium sp. TRM90804]
MNTPYPAAGNGRADGRAGGHGVVAEKEFASYYDRPILKPPTWKASNIAGYLYLGGLAGASSVLAAGGELTGRPRLARASRVAAVAGVSLSLAALIEDLGRPERFVNMLRTFKPTSPMSVGTWLLSAYTPLAVAGLASDLTGRCPALGRAAGYGAALLGPAVTTYTAALLSDTAVPAWHEGHRELPFLFAGSAAATAAGFALIATPLAENGPARRAALAGTAVELVAGRLMRRRMGMIADAYELGSAGALMRAAETLAVAGAAGTLLSRRRRALAVASGAALMAASAFVRFGVFAAGVASTEDPRYTVVPQRARASAPPHHPG